jgi:hypothetical protein
MASPSAESEMDFPDVVDVGSSSRRYKTRRTSTRVDPDGCWEDFFEAALLDNTEDERRQIEDERELAEAENGSVSSNSNSDDY